MTTEEAIAALKAIKQNGGDDLEEDHVKADDILLSLIGDDRVRAAFDAIDKWYA